MSEIGFIILRNVRESLDEQIKNEIVTNQMIQKELCEFIVYTYFQENKFFIVKNELFPAIESLGTDEKLKELNLEYNCNF